MKSTPIPPSRRQPVLLERRRMKMAESAHAYVRGNTVKFYEWLESSNAAKALPSGPPVWICGDCHTGNLGPVASSDGLIEIQIRDLDQTVIGNPVHDIVRLSLSLAMAARSSDLPGITTALMIEEVIRGYRRGLGRRHPEAHENEIEPIRRVMRQALRRKWRHLAEERIEDVTPQIPLGRRFWPLLAAERKAIERLFSEPEAQKLITGLKSRDAKDKVSVLDAAYWMKGCSSLGRVRYAVLAAVGKASHGEMCLIDIKEAAQAAAPRAKHGIMPSGNAERVVTGARALSPFLGERMLAARLMDKSVVLRELMPQDLKFEMERLSSAQAVGAAGLFAQVAGRAHGRQMDNKTRRAWSAELRRDRSKTLDAPSWLWKSVVELAANHEAAYLDHCRAYALKSPA